MPDSFSNRLATLTHLQQDFARLIVATADRQLSAEPGRPFWLHLDGPSGHGKSAVLGQLKRQFEEEGPDRVCAWLTADSGGVHRQILSTLAAAAPPLQGWEIRARIVLAAAPGVLAQRYLPVSLLVLAVLLVLSNPASLSPWGFLLAGLVAAVSVIAAWTGREAPLRLARPALRRACPSGTSRLALVLDDLDLAEPGEALRALDNLRKLTRELPIAVYVGCDRAWLSSLFASDAAAGSTAIGRSFDLSITVPLLWKNLAGADTEIPFEAAAGLEQANPRLLLRHRLATEVLHRIYRSCELEVSLDDVALWTLLCLRWPGLGEFLATYPARIAHFRYEQQPPEAPPEIAAYFTNPGVIQLLRPAGDKVALEEKTLRALLAPFPTRRVPVV